MPPKTYEAMPHDRVRELVKRYAPPKPSNPQVFSQYAYEEDVRLFAESIRPVPLPLGEHSLPLPSPKVEPVYPESWNQLSLSDEDLMDLVKTNPAWEAQMFGRIHLICPDAAVKSGSLYESEYLASELARTSTTIPIPRIHRFIRPSPEGGSAYMIMQWIPGRSLDRCWGELSLWRKIRIIWTLRGYVQQLRNILNPVPGRVGPMESSDRKASSAELWFGAMFGELGAGPFNSYNEMVDWQNEMLRIAKHYDEAQSSSPPFDTFYPLVFTHFDLQRRNLILDETNKLWVIDFGQAGFYPEPFEYVSTYGPWWENRGWRWLSRARATLIASLVAGFHQSYYASMYRNIEWAVDRGRRLWFAQHGNQRV